MLFYSIILLTFSSCGDSINGAEADIVTVRLAAPQNAYIEDFDTNLYKLWLEEQTGLKLEMTWYPEKDAEQIVKLALSTGQDLPDAYIGFGSMELFKNPNV